jgi:hypothetical protein
MVAPLRDRRTGPSSARCDVGVLARSPYDVPLQSDVGSPAVLPPADASSRPL